MKRPYSSSCAVTGTRCVSSCQFAPHLMKRALHSFRQAETLFCIPVRYKVQTHFDKVCYQRFEHSRPWFQQGQGRQPGFRLQGNQSDQIGQVEIGATLVTAGNPPLYLFFCLSSWFFLICSACLRSLAVGSYGFQMSALWWIWRPFGRLRTWENREMGRERFIKDFRYFLFERI